MANKSILPSAILGILTGGQANVCLVLQAARLNLRNNENGQ